MIYFFSHGIIKFVVEFHGNAKVNIITDDLNYIISIFESGKAFCFSLRGYDDFS